MPTSALTNVHYANIAAQVPELLRYANAHCASTNTAEDLVEESIIRALIHPRTFRNQGEMRSWLFVTVHNLCVAEGTEEQASYSLLSRSAEQRRPSYSRLLLRALDKAAMTLPRQRRQDLAIIAAEISLRDSMAHSERVEIWHERQSTTLH
ncbi:MAG TPA: sigma factor [Kiloniellales bacterium]|nr:sigma factor [Kiloniellales bacterium]